MTWQTSNPITWFSSLYWALWNSVIATWDDAVVTWDASDDHNWQTDNVQNWYIKS